MALLDELVTEVEENKTVVASAVTLLQGLSEALKDAGTDPVKLKALSTQLSNQTDALSAAVVANTPSQDDPPVEPPVEE